MAVVLLSFVLDRTSPSAGMDLCGFHKFTNLPCPGCGITRAIVSFGHGDPLASFRWHPLGPLAWLAALVGASSLLWPGAWFQRLAGFFRDHRTVSDRILYACIILLNLFGLARILFVYTHAPRWWPW